MFAVAAGNVNGGLVDFFHGIQVAVMLMLMTNIVQFGYWTCKRMRKGRGHWDQYRPVYIILLSVPMVLLQPVCMLVIGSWICKGAFSADQLHCNDAGTSCITPCDQSNLTPAEMIKQGCQGWYKPDGSFYDPSSNPTLPDGESIASAVDYPMGTNFVDGCSDSMKNFFFDGGVDSNALTPNTTVGWMIQIFGTYLGFIVMFIGVCQATNLHNKIINKWKSIRSRPST